MKVNVSGNKSGFLYAWVMVLILMAPACDEDSFFDSPDNPDGPNRPANCNIQADSLSAFVIYNTPPLTDSAGWEQVLDTGVIGTIRFTKQAPYDSVKWTIGTDPRVFTDDQFSLRFNSDFGPIQVQMIGYGTDGVGCSTVRVDTFRRTIRLILPSVAPIQGFYYGALTEAPTDSFLLNTNADIWSLPGGVAGGAVACDTAFGPGVIDQTPRIVHPLRFYFRSNPPQVCEFDLDGRLSEDRQTLTIEYRFLDATDGVTKTRTFVGVRQ